jgi:hypothetical protein
VTPGHRGDDGVGDAGQVHDVRLGRSADPADIERGDSRQWLEPWASRFDEHRPIRAHVTALASAPNEENRTEPQRNQGARGSRGPMPVARDERSRVCDRR